MTEDRKIKTLFGKNNHFQVPAGYFDNLTAQIMDKLPEREAHIVSITSHKAFWHQLLLHKVAAAVAAVFIVGGSAAFIIQHEDHRHSQIASHANLQSFSSSWTSSDDQAFDQMADYAMMDSEDFYASLIAEN